MTQFVTADAMYGAPVLLTPDDVATRLGISRENVFKLMRASQLAYVRVGKFYRIAEADLADFVARHRHSTGTDVAVRRPRSAVRRSTEPGVAS